MTLRALDLVILDRLSYLLLIFKGHKHSLYLFSGRTLYIVIKEFFVMLQLLDIASSTDSYTLK